MNLKTVATIPDPPTAIKVARQEDRTYRTNRTYGSTEPLGFSYLPYLSHRSYSSCQLASWQRDFLCNLFVFRGFK